MKQSSFSATSRRNADKNLLTILLAGVGGSLAFHVAAFAGVAHWWKPVVAIDEPMEITMVDTAPEPPPVKPAPTPKPVPIVKAEPKPVPIVKVPAKLEPKPVAAKPIPIVKTAASLDNLVDRQPAKPVSKPVPKQIAPQPTPVIPPAFPEQLFKSPQPAAKTPVAPKQKVASQPKQQKIVTEPQPGTPIGENQSGLASNSPNRQLAARSTDTPTPTQEQDFGQVTPSKVNAPTEDIAPSSNNQSGLTGNPVNNTKLAGRLAGNNTSSSTDDNFGEIAPSKIKTPTADDFAGSSNNQSGLAGKPTSGGKLGTRLAGNAPSSNTSDGDPAGVAPGKSWNSARAEPGAGLKPNPGNSDGDDAGGGVFGLQCIKRCEISGLVDLEDRDGGKDKLRIKIAIDPKGNVTRASVAKSSGNSTIDRVVINGVKQMQFSPPGKIVERVVKANILL
ncbi:TonB family protein [Chamaesiphon sp. VAR_48_metabat_403]|uniref:TonB family protein n=1 Tax=Chamaesiphon sp. VAR_48_metabat_403 TaxID=2964700 RepID=UPI00286E0BF8|nr:TonB family protein [Chamaesiphon sp. VAR_48_metabat_403]